MCPGHCHDDGGGDDDGGDDDDDGDEDDDDDDGDDDAGKEVKVLQRLVGAVVSIFQPFLSLALTAAVFRRQTLGNGAKAGNTLQLWRTHNGEVEARNWLLPSLSFSS